MPHSASLFEEVSNPLDSIEDFLFAENYAFERPTMDELNIYVKGQKGTYNMIFLWEEDFTALQFMCELDLKIPHEKRETATQTLGRINEKLWLGHFDVPGQTNTPCFRHTSLMRGWTEQSGADHIQDLMDIAKASCDRYYNMFALLATSKYMNNDLIDLAISDAGGAA